jgi:hypothetical protein
MSIRPVAELLENGHQVTVAQSLEVHHFPASSGDRCSPAIELLLTWCPVDTPDLSGVRSTCRCGRCDRCDRFEEPALLALLLLERVARRRVAEPPVAEPPAAEPPAAELPCSRAAALD